MVKKWYVQYELKLQFVFQTQREEETKKSGVSEFRGDPCEGSSLDTFVGNYLILFLDVVLSDKVPVFSSCVGA